MIAITDKFNSNSDITLYQIYDQKPSKNPLLERFFLIYNSILRNKLFKFCSKQNPSFNYRNLLRITRGLCKQKSENFEKKAQHVIHNVCVIHENKKQKFIKI